MLLSLLRRLSATGWRRGLSGSRTWLAVGILAAALRMLHRMSRDGDDVLYRTVVVPGDRFEILTKIPKKK